DTLPAATGWPRNVTLPTTVPPRPIQIAPPSRKRPSSGPTNSTPATTRARRGPVLGQKAHAPATAAVPSAIRIGPATQNWVGRVTRATAKNTHATTTGAKAKHAPVLRAHAGSRPGHKATSGPPSKSEKISFNIGHLLRELVVAGNGFTAARRAQRPPDGRPRRRREGANAAV